MRKDYEIKYLLHQYGIFAAFFLFLVFCAGFWCSSYSLSKAAVPFLCCLFFTLCTGLFFHRKFSALLKDVESISQMMINIVEGKECGEKEPYREGTLGNLYTNFYKMVGALRESQMKTQEEKEFLRTTMSDISHQLKTPLASLRVFLELLCEDKVADINKQKQLLREAGNQLDRMEWLVLSMLKLARIEAGVISFQQKDCSLAAIVKQAIDSVRYMTELRKQTIRVIWSVVPTEEGNEAAPDMILRCDREWLTEAIINLLKNASDYSAECTEITVELDNNHLFSRISVRDQGIGIPEDALPHIFERFYRVNNEVNPNSVGIGLSLTRSIVEGMGGHITVRSEVGKYTCFLLTFLKQ